MNLSQLLEQVCAIVREDGERILAMRHPEIYTKEGHANFVTSADLASQDFLVERLTPLLPQAHFFAEEQEDNVLAPGYNWLIDPIDGTTNFMRGMRASSISVALTEDDRCVLGVVYNFYTGELFSAVRGMGAHLNGAPIHAACVPLDQTLICVGTAPYDRGLMEGSLEVIRTLYASCGDLRRGGSAAIDLCCVAAGRADGFFEARLSPWDYAAGSVILREAGGLIGTAPGKDFRYEEKQPILAGTPQVYPLLVQEMQRYV